MRLLRPHLFVLVASATACAGGAARAADPVPGASPAAASASATTSARREFGEIGHYRFEERRDGIVVLRGTFTVRADTVMLDGEPGPCRAEASLRLSTSIGYKCADIVVRFDLERPASRATFTWNRSIVTSRRVCTQPGTDAAGRPICNRYETETTERFELTSSRIRATKL